MCSTRHCTLIKICEYEKQKYTAKAISGLGSFLMAFFIFFTFVQINIRNFNEYTEPNRKEDRTS